MSRLGGRDLWVFKTMGLVGSPARKPTISSVSVALEWATSGPSALTGLDAEAVDVWATSKTTADLVARLPSRLLAFNLPSYSINQFWLMAWTTVNQCHWTHLPESLPPPLFSQIKPLPSLLTRIPTRSLLLCNIPLHRLGFSPPLLQSGCQRWQRFHLTLPPSSPRVSMRLKLKADLRVTAFFMGTLSLPTKISQ